VTTEVSVLALKSQKAQVEIGLLYAQHRRAELLKQLQRLEDGHRRGQVPAPQVRQVRQELEALSAEIDAQTRALQALTQQLQATPATTVETALSTALRQHATVTAEIAALRQTILATLTSLAEPLRRYQTLVAEKTQLVQEIQHLTGRDQRYAHYIESALLRQTDYTADLAFVLETLKKTRVVA